MDFSLHLDGALGRSLRAQKEKLAQSLISSSILLRKREKSAALGILVKALQQDSYHLWGLWQLTQALPAQARTARTKSLELIALRSPTFINLALWANSLYDEGKIREAKRAYFKTLEKEVEGHELCFEVFKNLGNIFVQEQDFDAAEEYYQKALLINQRSATLFTNLGVLSLQTQNLEEAKISFAKAVEIDARLDSAWVGLAICHYQKSDFELALANLEKALDLNPKNRTAVHLYCNWCVALNILTKGIDRLMDYLAWAYDDVEMSQMAAYLFEKQGLQEWAQVEQERCRLFAFS
jgi:tetratricopeptide (TPR) repeat protein